MSQLIQCPYCGDSSLKPYAARIQKNYPHSLRVVCCRCGLIFSNPQATPEELDIFYQNYYDKGNFTQWKEQILAWKDSFDKGLTNEGNNNIYKYLPHIPGAKWLEIGAGLGKLSYIAKSKGFDVTVTEIDNDASTFLITKMGFNNCLIGNIECLYSTNQLLDNFYDIVVLNHVLEHVNNLFGTLDLVHRILKPNGVCYIGVPNLDNFGYSLYRTLCYLTMRIPGIIDGNEHTFGFTPKTLRQCLERLNFQIRSIRTFGKGETIPSLLETRRKRGVRKAIVALAESVFSTRMDCVAIKKIEGNLI